MSPSSTFSLCLTLFLSLTLFPLVSGDALEDLWNQYVQATEAKKYESTGPRRERNLDHWDVHTAAAYLGLHPKTLQPLPRHLDESSSTEPLDESSSTEAVSSASTGVTPSASIASAAAVAAAPRLADEYVGYDAAVLFYAQWCQNCHAVAPSWDAIATHLGAGSRPSNLVMALFDCEKNTSHAQICLAAGIKAYPTLMFVGSGEYHDTDFITRGVLGRDASAGPFGAAPLRRTVKFQGNWQYADQILDWVNLMRGLSSWHSITESGPLRFLRNGMFSLITGGKSRKYRRAKGKENSLPVGVPPNFQAELRGLGVEESATVSKEEVKDLETKLNATGKEKEMYEKAVAHSSRLLDSLLLPKNTNTSTPPRDPFSILTESGGWYQNATTLPKNAPNDEHPSILRSCTLELSVDYCSRVTTRMTNVYITELSALPDSEPSPSLDEIEERLLELVRQSEPYCSLMEGCILADYEDEECRPAKCPFENVAACTYVGNCLDPDVQDEYGLALGLIEKWEKVGEKDFGKVEINMATGNGGNGYGEMAGGSEKKGDSANSGGNADIRGWGIPANL